MRNVATRHGPVLAGAVLAAGAQQARTAAARPAERRRPRRASR